MSDKRMKIIDLDKFDDEFNQKLMRMPHEGRVKFLKKLEERGTGASSEVARVYESMGFHGGKDDPGLVPHYYAHLLTDRAVHLQHLFKVPDEDGQPLPESLGKYDPLPGDVMGSSGNLVLPLFSYKKAGTRHDNAPYSQVLDALSDVRFNLGGFEYGGAGLMQRVLHHRIRERSAQGNLPVLSGEPPAPVSTDSLKSIGRLRMK